MISSNRLQNSIPRNVLSYPVSRHYYEMLDDGRLGFRKLREFTSYPSLLGISFPDAGQQESWSSYDHPRVQVYQKTPAYTHQRAEQLLLTGPAGVPALPKDAGKHGLLMSESVRETQVANGTWTSVFSTSGIGEVTAHAALAAGAGGRGAGRDADRAGGVSRPAGPRLPARQAAGPAHARLPRLGAGQPQDRALRPDDDRRGAVGARDRRRLGRQQAAHGARGVCA